MGAISTETVTITEELRACPFCGNNGVKGIKNPMGLQLVSGMYDVCGIGLEKRQYFQVKCGNCGAAGGMGMAHYNGLLQREITAAEARKIAVDKWNGRA